MIHDAPTQLRESLATRGRLAADFAAFADSIGFGAPTRKCAWCGRILQAGGQTLTHTICPACEADMDGGHGGARGRGSSEVLMTPTLDGAA